MGYTVETYRFGSSNEIEIKWKGNYGAKGEKRQPRKKATPEQIEKQNQRNRENLVRRLIKANFTEGDLWCTLKYLAGTRKTFEEYKKDVKRFLDKCREWWKKRGSPFKYIYRLEIGKKGGVHLHMICNRLEPEKGKPDTDELLQKAWTHGRINFESLYDAGGYQSLAEYLVKRQETEGQISMFSKKELRAYRDYHPSRNLVRPEPEVKEYKRRTVRSIALDPPEPTPGYYVDKSSIRQGINPYTGLSYCHYIEYRIRHTWEDG